MRDIQKMMAYVDFNEADIAQLRALLPLVEPHLESIVDRFYEAIQRNPETNSVMKSQEQVNRLKGTLVIWIRELLTGPHDDVYWERRLRIGRTHVRVGLPNRYVFTALNLIRHELIDIAFRVLDSVESLAACAAVGKITDLEMAVMSGTYLEAHEDQAMRALQNLIVSNLPLTLLSLDAAGHITAASSLFRETSEGSHYQEVLPADVIAAADLDGMIRESQQTGRAVLANRVVVGRGARARRYKIGVVPLNHELVRTLVYLEDLTDTLRAEVRLQQAEALARIGALAANVAHEIRNPLTAISTTLQVITTSFPADDPRREVLEMVKAQITRLDRLVTDLLSYARPADAHLEGMDLMAIAQSSVIASAAEVPVTGEPVSGQVDPRMVQQILINLLINAQHVAGPGGVRVVVGPGPQIAVEDDGPGIEPEVAETLFEPFVTTKAKGTGLGLAISVKLAEAMGGTLTLDESYTDGARFVLELTAEA